MSLMRLGKHINQARSDVKHALYFAGLRRAKRRYE
jgi:hypothetical protein